MIIALFRVAARNQSRACDFVFDACANVQKLKCLTIVDEWTREALAIDVAGSIQSDRGIEVLARLISVHGTPKHLPSDNGPKSVSAAILRWLAEAQIDTAHIDPGRPWQNGTPTRASTGRVPEHLVVPLEARGCDDHRAVPAALQRGPAHPSLKCLTPAEFQQKQESARNHVSGAVL